MSSPNTPMNESRWGSISHPKRVDPIWMSIGGPIIRYTLLIILSIIFLFPFYLMIRGALSTKLEVNAPDWVWWPADPQWNNWNALFDDGKANMALGLRNSAALAIINLLLQTLFASMAGYALARIAVRGSGIVLSFILLMLAFRMAPATVVLPPLGYLLHRPDTVPRMRSLLTKVLR